MSLEEDHTGLFNDLASDLLAIPPLNRNGPLLFTPLEMSEVAVSSPASRARIVEATREDQKQLLAEMRWSSLVRSDRSPHHRCLSKTGRTVQFTILKKAAQILNSRPWTVCALDRQGQHAFVSQEIADNKLIVYTTQEWEGKSSRERFEHSPLTLYFVPWHQPNNQVSFQDLSALESSPFYFTTSGTSKETKNAILAKVQERNSVKDEESRPHKKQTLSSQAEPATSPLLAQFEAEFTGRTQLVRRLSSRDLAFLQAKIVAEGIMGASLWLNGMITLLTNPLVRAHWEFGTIAGFIDRQSAPNYLRMRENGTFLIGVSNTDPSKLVVLLVKAGRIEVARVSVSSQGVCYDDGILSPSLEQLLAESASLETLLTGNGELVPKRHLLGVPQEQPSYVQSFRDPPLFNM